MPKVPMDTNIWREHVVALLEELVKSASGDVPARPEPLERPKELDHVDRLRSLLEKHPELRALVEKRIL